VLLGGATHMNSFGFGEQLAMSDGHASNVAIGDILLDLIPGAMAVTRASRGNDRSGTDWWVEVMGRHLAVDAKVRSSDRLASHGQDDLALEVWSVCGVRLHDGTRKMDPMKIGWSRDANKRTDYVLWMWKDTGRYCLVPFPFLCRVFQEKWSEWEQQYHAPDQFTKSPSADSQGWFSQCVYVPRRVLWAEIYKRYAPNLAVASEAAAQG
jgi:hypothetical protein